MTETSPDLHSSRAKVVGATVSESHHVVLVGSLIISLSKARPQPPITGSNFTTGHQFLEEFTMEIRDALPAHLPLKIESFSKLSKHGILKHESREFVAGNYKWRLIIYPQDFGGSDVSVFLLVAETESLPEGWEFTANCNILLHNQISDKYFYFRGQARRFDAKNSRWGFSISGRMLVEACNGDDNCTFGAEVFLSKTHVSECLSLHDWKIFDFSKLGDVWISEEFLAGGFRWKMKLFPNGKGDGKGKSVSIYLESLDSKNFAPHEKVKADFCIRIKKKLPHAHASKSASHLVSSKEINMGFPNFILIADMRDPSKCFVVNDLCLLEVEISMQDAIYEPKIEMS